MMKRFVEGRKEINRKIKEKRHPQEYLTSFDRWKTGCVSFPNNNIEIG